MPNVSIYPDIKSKYEVHFAWAEYENVCISEPHDDLSRALSDQERHAREIVNLKTISRHPGVLTSRKVFKSLGIDPARYRPSQEALFRRVLQNKPIPLINSGVDVNNVLSLKFVLPMGLYDKDKIVSAPQIKIGEVGEVYEALNGRLIDCENKWIIRDREGPFGSPFVDSVRTAVSLNTKNLFHVIYFLYMELPKDALEYCRSTMEYYLKGHCKGYFQI